MIHSPKHFRKLADREHAGIEANGHDHFFADFEAHPEHAADIEAEVMAAYAASPFAASMDKALAARNVHEVVNKWMRDAQNMHRDWFHRWGKVGHHTELSKGFNFQVRQESRARPDVERYPRRPVCEGVR